MTKNDHSTDLCSHLEQWGQDDLNLLSEFGASGFSTPQLFHMRVELTDKLVMSDRRYNFLFLSLFCSFGWALFGTGLLVIGMDKLAYPVFGLFTLCTTIAATGILLLNKSGNGTKHLNHYLELVQIELENRKYARMELQP